MAAIICKSISSCFEVICCAPCKLCSGGCKLCSNGIHSLCTNPLSAFVVITFLTQIPLAVAAAMELGGLLNGCKGSQWLVGMLVVAIAHIAASVYLAHRISNRTDEALRDKHSSWERISYLLCHDPWIALYLLIVIFFVAWLCVGSSWSLRDRMNNSSGCGSNLDDRLRIVMGLGWFYLFAGPAVLSCNLCCVCCDKTDYAADDAAFAANAAEKEAKKQRHSSANNSADIETPYPNPNQNLPKMMPETKTKEAPSPPRTYSINGIPIRDDGNADVVEADVVIEGDTLPPPMPPSKDSFTAQAAKAEAKVEKTVKSVNQKVGGWFKKKSADGNLKQLPDTEATLY